MTTNTQTSSRKQTDAAHETSQFALGTGMVLAALVGIWGVTCLVSALIGEGPLNVLKSYFTAMVG